MPTSTNKLYFYRHLSTVHYYIQSFPIDSYTILYVKTMIKSLMDTQYSPNDLQWHKVLSGASDLLDKSLYQSGCLIFLCRQGCLEGGEHNNGLFQICITQKKSVCIPSKLFLG